MFDNSATDRNVKAVSISVIVPVYNVEKYLRECLESIRRQTFTDFEVILVDDGSTDASASIMDEYKKIDSRFTIVKHKRSNAGACRNAGLQLAHGEYLIFLDSDDVFSPCLLEVLIDGSERFKADIACCSFLEFFDGEPNLALSTNKIVRWQDCTLNCPEHANFDIATASPQNKLYRREYIINSGIKYVEQPTTNDVTFVWAAIANASKVIITNEAYIAYRRRRNSIQDKKSAYPECAIVANRRFVEELVRLNIVENRPWIYEYYRVSKPGGYIDYLSTLRSRKAYMLAYTLIRDELIKMWAADKLLVARNDRFTRRACGIITNSFKEKVQRNLESFLSPFLGQCNYERGLKRWLIVQIRRLMILVFDFWPTVKRITGSIYQALLSSDKRVRLCLE